jgi:hypothetical protein
MDISKKFANALNEKFSDYTFDVDYGRKFDKVTQERVTGGGGSVHAFIERETGKLIKAAGWNAPQKGVNGLAYRYDLSTEEGFDLALEKSDQYGGYLYAR